jgi:methionyl-tRNA synthetase
LVTSALPYANGHIHLGHLVEYLQTDIWVRFQKLRGRQTIYICADDTHGTAIMIRARAEGVREEELIARMRQAHLDDFHRFGIEFDNYGSTNSPETRAFCEEIWTALRKAGLVSEKDVAQLYDPVAGTFLADRFVKGTCPHCKAPDQYGDSCEKCGHTYSPTELVDPVSTLSGARPEVRTASHLFVDIEQLHGFLANWTQAGGHLQPEIANYLQGHFLQEPLREWDISRPAPYFGFEIPDSPGNYWYVWFDAPIGYIGSTCQWCQRNGQSLDDWWRSEQAEIHHFIGKDITYFHTLFWPAMLKTAGFRLPEKVHIHGFLTVDGTKMSKSRGTFIRASTYLAHLDPSYLRYYYASKLSGGVDDLDLNFDEFVAKINSDLVGKVVNLASRTAGFLKKTGLSPEYPHALDDHRLFTYFAMDGNAIAKAYEEGDYNRAMRHIMADCDQANQFIDQHAPWTLAKDPAKSRQLQDVCTVGLNLFRQLAIYLTPVLPRLKQQTEELFGRPIEHWDESKQPLTGTSVNPFKHMMTRVRREQVDAMIEESKERETTPTQAGVAARANDATGVAAGKEPDAGTRGHGDATTRGQGDAGTVAPAAAAPQDSEATLVAEPLVAEVISIDDFTKIDLRVARIEQAEDVPQADKLLKLTVSLGGQNRRTVFAGIKKVYKPEQLVGRLVILVANLAPRKMKFGLSEGMVLAAGAGGSEIYMLSPDEGAKPGHRVH